MDIDSLASYTARHRTRRRNMENGTVKKTGKREKKWIGFYHAYKKLADGTERRDKARIILGRCADMTKGQAEEALRVFIRRKHEMPVTEVSRAKLKALCDDLVELKKGDWSEHTRSTYAGTFRLIVAGLGDRPVDQITADDLKRFVNNLPNRQWSTPKGTVKTGASVSLVKDVITMLRLLFDWALERELIRTNPSRSATLKLRVPKTARKPTKTIFPPQELSALMRELTDRDRIIVWISILVATRPNEMFALLGRDIGPNWIRIEKALDRLRNVKETKTGEKGERYAYLPEFLAADLRRWMASSQVGPDDLVFPNQAGRPIARDNFLKRRLRPAAKRAKIATSDVDFRMLRRSFATLAPLAGMDVKAIQAQLGHANPDMTAGTYMQPVDGQRAAQMEKLCAMIRGEIPMPVDVTAKLGSKLVN